MTRAVYYVAHPLRPTEEEIAAAMSAVSERVDPRDRGPAIREALALNLARAQRWLVWLRRSFPESTFIAPWIAAVLSGEDDNDPAQREAGLIDAEAVAAVCTGVILCGGRVSGGMRRESRAAQRVWDLTIGDPPDGTCCDDPTPGRMPFSYWAESLEIRGAASTAIEAAP